MKSCSNSEFKTADPGLSDYAKHLVSFKSMISTNNNKKHKNETKNLQKIMNSVTWDLGHTYKKGIIIIIIIRDSHSFRYSVIWFFSFLFNIVRCLVPV